MLQTTVALPPSHSRNMYEVYCIRKIYDILWCEIRRWQQLWLVTTTSRSSTSSNKTVSKTEFNVISSSTTTVLQVDGTTGEAYNSNMASTSAAVESPNWSSYWCNMLGKNPLQAHRCARCQLFFFYCTCCRIHRAHTHRHKSEIGITKMMWNNENTRK